MNKIIESINDYSTLCLYVNDKDKTLFLKQAKEYGFVWKDKDIEIDKDKQRLDSYIIVYKNKVRRQTKGFIDHMMINGLKKVIYNS